MSAQEGNRQLFESLFRQHAAFVWRVLQRLGVQEADLEDAVQEVFLVVSRKLDSYDERGAARAWLFTIARQVASHFRRSHLRLATKQQALREQPLPAPNGPDVRVEAASLVRAFMLKLDPNQAMVFYLSDVEGMTAPEIAVALGLKLTTVHGRLRLARSRFEALARIHRGTRS